MADDVLISLVGLPGSGKSTVGRHLAKHLSLPFIDADQEFERRMEGSIRDFFEREGEARFRDIEAELLDELTHKASGVLSTGGGVVLQPRNRQCLHDRTRVIYLRSNPEDIYRRLKHDRQRPLLQVADPLRRLRDLFVQRDPLYREVAHFVIETGRPSVAALVNMILMQLELAGVTGQGRQSQPAG